MQWIFLFVWNCMHRALYLNCILTLRLHLNCGSQVLLTNRNQTFFCNFFIIYMQSLPVSTYEHLSNDLKNPGVGVVSRFSSFHNLLNRLITTQILKSIILGISLHRRFGFARRHSSGRFLFGYFSSLIHDLYYWICENV